jgi:copper homeostasis protein (lipoprotein)
MKRTIYLCIVTTLFFTACNKKSQKAEETSATVAVEQPADQVPVQIDPASNTPAKKFGKPTETFIGTVNGMKVVFKHKDYTQYRLKEGDNVTQGALNSERGFEEDEDATVFILNSDKPESEQKYFVRFTDGRVMMLDAQRKVIPGSKLKKQ